MDPVNLTVEMRDVYQKPKKRQGSSGSSSLPVERKKSKHCSMLVKSLVLVIALLVLCCLVLLSLYLIERDRNSQPDEKMMSVNSTSQTSKQQSHYGGLCWSRDCLHAASGRLIKILHYITANPVIIILYKCKTRGISFRPEMTSTNDVTIPSLVKVTPIPSPPQTSPTKKAAPEYFGQTLLQGTFRYLSLL